MIATILIGCLFLAVLELNKNTIWGWLLALAVLAVFLWLVKTVLPGKAWYVRCGAWVGFLAALALILTGTQGPFKARPAVENAGGKTEIYTVSEGQLRGMVTGDGQVEVFTGVPYARPPVGELRWREPRDPEPWEGVLEADHFAPMSMQSRNPEFINSLVDIIGYHDYTVKLNDSFRDLVSEDSLYLNIWKPAGKQENLPVMVYVHGGSLTSGQPWYADYSGEGLAREGVIVVNMGYRLGVFGFLALPELAAESPNGTTGNYGLLDQIKALEWVRDNISAFGGNPDNVTLAGESAGSACVTALCTSPLAKGLFRRVIGESSTVTSPVPTHSYRTYEEALAAGRAVKERFGAESLAQLRALDAKALTAASADNHHITVDGYVLPRSPYESYALGEHNEEAVLHGYNRTEGSLFILMDNARQSNYEKKIRGYFKEYADEVLALYPSASDAEAKDNWIDVYSSIFFNYGHHCWTRQALRSGIPVYEYWFTKDNRRLGANHGGEEVYFYNNIPSPSKLYDESDYALEAVMRRYFVNFLTCGDPNGEGLPRWEPTEGPGQLMELGDHVGMTEERGAALYDVFDRLYGWQQENGEEQTK